MFSFGIFTPRWASRWSWQLLHERTTLQKLLTVFHTANRRTLDTLSLHFREFVDFDITGKYYEAITAPMKPQENGLGLLMPKQSCQLITCFSRIVATSMFKVSLSKNTTWPTWTSKKMRLMELIALNKFWDRFKYKSITSFANNCCRHINPKYANRSYLMDVHLLCHRGGGISSNDMFRYDLRPILIPVNKWRSSI